MAREAHSTLTDDDRTTAGKPSQAVAGYVLAGGASSRFGSDKAVAAIGGKPMLARMCELLVKVSGQVRIVAAPGASSKNETAVIPDRWPGQGPLGGIITALLATAAGPVNCEWNLIVGCDMPFLTPDWLRYLVQRALASSAEMIAPRSQKGLEPLCTCWRTSAAPKLQTAFDTGGRKITEAMKHLTMEIVDERDWKRFDNSGRLFLNMNTTADYEEAKRILETQRA